MADDKNPLDRANWSPKLRAEMEAMTSTQRAAVLMLLLGEDQAANIIKYLNPKEVQALGAAMVAAADLSQEAVNVVLDEFVEMLKNQTSLSLGNSDYVEKVLRRALGDDKANSVLNRIMPGQGSKGEGRGAETSGLDHRFVILSVGEAWQARSAPAPGALPASDCPLEL